jgi:O-antigen ligase
MKQFFYINDTAENKISFCHLALFLLLLPFDYFYSQLVLISFGLHTLMHIKKNSLSLLLKKETWLPALVFVVLLLSITYSADKKEGLDISGRQSALLLLPLLLALTNLDIAKYKLQLLQLFAITCTAVVLYLYADALYTIRYFNLPAASLFTAAFTNHNFSQPIALHATYLSMYIALSVAVFLYCFLLADKRAARLFFAGCILILDAGLLQLTSRAVVIALLLTVAGGFAFFLLKGKKKWVVAGIISVLSVAAATVVLQNSAFKQRYITELKNDLANQPVTDAMLEPRIVRWQLALALIGKAPLLGYGNGAEKKILKQEYFTHRFYISFLRGFNAHSQYLSFLLRTGIAGLAVFLTLLWFAFRTAFIKKDFLFFAFLVITATVAVSENILDVNKGIFFYGFFLSFFLTGQTAAGCSKATE